MSTTTPDETLLNYADHSAVERAAIARFDELSCQWGGEDCKKILHDWFPQLLARVRKQKNDEARTTDYQEEINDAARILVELRDAFSVNVDRPNCNTVQDGIWSWPSERGLKFLSERWHRTRHSESWLPGATSPTDNKILARELSGYVERPWLQHNIIDGAAINAFLFSALSAAMDLDRMGAFGPTDWGYMLRKLGYSGHRFWSELFGIVLQWIVLPLLKWTMVPVVATSLFFAGYQTYGEVFLGIWIVFIIYALATLKSRRNRRKEACGTIGAMRAAWEYSCGEIISPKRLRELVIAAEDKGAIEYPPILHTLIERAIRRDATAFQTRK